MKPYGRLEGKETTEIMKLKTLLIYNPTAGPWKMTRALKRLAASLNHGRWSVEMVETNQPGDAMTYAQQAARSHHDVVLVAGGDGTINEVVNGVHNSSTILGIVPMGTGNILAHQLRMPMLSLTTPYAFKETVTALQQSRVQRVDAGVLGERYFICWAGIGLDAEVTAQMEPRSRYAKHLHALPYIIAAFTVASEFKGMRTEIDIEGSRIRSRTLMVLASNIQLYASFFSVARHAQMDDGLLDIFVFKGLGLGYALEHVVKLYQGRHFSDPRIIHALAPAMHVETSPETAVHLDGDPYGHTPANISLAPGAVRLLVPPQAPDDLFSHPPVRKL